MSRYTETSRVTGYGYSVAIYRIGEPGSGKYVVQECESAFLPSPTKRLQWDVSYSEAREIMERWVDEGRAAAGVRPWCSRIA